LQITREDELNIPPLPSIYKMEIVYYVKLNVSWLENDSIRNDDDDDDIFHLDFVGLILF
jgi:hypothetical protein